MNKNSITWFGYLISIAFLIFSCAGTEITEKKVDSAYKGKPVSDILVIAITGNEHNRKTFENRFVTHLKSAGVDAVASVEAIPMPPDLELKKETILNTVSKYENDAVIITHLIGKEEKDFHTRTSVSHRGFYGFYHNRYSTTVTSSPSTSVRLETNLYDVKTEKLMWSGRSKTWSREDSQSQIINDVIKTVINNLKKNKLIAPK